MALSRFWSFIIAGSIVYIFILLASGRIYTISNVVNGKQNDPVVTDEIPAAEFQQKDSLLFSIILLNKQTGFQQGDTLYRLTENGVVEICEGKQPADGIF